MLDQSLLDSLRETIGIVLAARGREFLREVERIKQGMAVMGPLGSGPTAERVRRLCENEVGERARSIVGQLLRAAAATGTGPADCTARELKEELRKHLPPEPRDLLDAYHEAARGTPESERRPPSFALPREKALRQADAEIEAFFAAKGAGTSPAASPDRAPAGREASRGLTDPGVAMGPSDGEPVLGKVGPGGAAERDRLIEALTDLRHEVQKWSRLGGFPREEVVALIDEARLDVGREHPSRFRLSALGQAIAALAETVAALRPAYIVLKEALVPYGIDLP